MCYMTHKSDKTAILELFSLYELSQIIYQCALFTRTSTHHFSLTTLLYFLEKQCKGLLEAILRVSYNTVYSGLCEFKTS